MFQHRGNVPSCCQRFGFCLFSLCLVKLINCPVDHSWPGPGRFFRCTEVYHVTFRVIPGAVCVLSTYAVVGRFWKLLIGYKSPGSEVTVGTHVPSQFHVALWKDPSQSVHPEVSILTSSLMLPMFGRVTDQRKRLKPDFPLHPPRYWILRSSPAPLLVHVRIWCSFFFPHKWFVCFLLLWWSYLYIPDTNPLSAECVTNIFSQLVPCAFRLFMLFDEFQCPRMCRLFLRCLWFWGFKKAFLSLQPQDTLLCWLSELYKCLLSLSL